MSVAQTSVLEDGPAIPIENCVGISESVFEPDPHAGGRPYVPNYRTLCSIFPDKLEHTMLHAGGRKTYSMPAVPKGSYALLRVYDTWTLTANLAFIASAGEDEFDTRDAMQRSPVSCRGVADDLIRQWAQDAPGNASGAKPGIVEIAGDRPTQLELDQLNAMQTTYFRWLVMKADDYWITGQRTFITDDHRRALRWLGSEDRDWYKKIQAVLLKRCIACAEEINAMAVRCKHCNVNLISFYAEIGREPAYEEDPAVFQHLRKLATQRKAELDKKAEDLVEKTAHEMEDDEARIARIKRQAAIDKQMADDLEEVREKAAAAAAKREEELREAASQRESALREQATRPPVEEKPKPQFGPPIKSINPIKR